MHRSERVGDRQPEEALADATHAPWERRPDESAAAYAAFLTYRDLGPERSLVAAARQAGKHACLLRRWSQRSGWVERVKQ